MVSTEMGVKKYKLVRRGQKWCVRVKGVVNTTDSWHWCRERNMTYSNIKQHWNRRRPWKYTYFKQVRDWDYDFIFDKEYEATAFMIGYL